MIIDDYYKAVDDLFAKCRATQAEAMKKAGEMMADTMLAGNVVHIFDSGHIINSEMTNRSGGLAAPQMLRYWLHTESDGRPNRPAEKNKNRTQIGMAQLVINAGAICDGDLLFIGSVSGRNEQVVDLAMTAKANGCKIISLTSMEYTTSVESAHPSGKKVYQVADLVIDNCAPLGDGMLHVPELDMPFIPASGLSAVYLMWGVYAECAQALLARGVKPSILKSSNTPGGDDYNLKMEQRFHELGY